jgi:hypothetical protein
MPLPYLVVVASRVRAFLSSFLAASCSVFLSSRVVSPRAKRFWFAVFGLPALFATCCCLLVLRVLMNGGCVPYQGVAVTFGDGFRNGNGRRDAIGSHRNGKGEAE